MARHQQRLGAIGAHLQPAASTVPAEPSPSQRAVNPLLGAPFPYVEISGSSAREVGLAHGRALAATAGARQSRLVRRHVFEFYGLHDGAARLDRGRL